jgi:hypothetical protein
VLIGVDVGGRGTVEFIVGEEVVVIPGLRNVKRR